MVQRKLQVFVSSTYTDLIPERLAAMEAILAAGHIPAAMEQFSPGDEGVWEKIERWIDQSDAFLLILGGRYGSVDKSRDKSFVEMEYSHALQTKKPFVSLVIDDKALMTKIGEDVQLYDERENPDRYKVFRKLVLEKHCSIWSDKKDIKNTILQKLPDWNSREDLKGWVPASSALNPNVANELARLSEENQRLLSEKRKEDFDGLTFHQLVDQMKSDLVDQSELASLEEQFILTPGFEREQLGKALALTRELGSHAGGLFEAFGEALAMQLVRVSFPIVFTRLAKYNLVERGSYGASFTFSLTPVGRRFRNALLKCGSGGLEERIEALWR